MQMYEVVALSEDMQQELARKIIYADDEDDAIDQMQEELNENHTTYGMCMASEI